MCPSVPSLSHTPDTPILRGEFEGCVVEHHEIQPGYHRMRIDCSPVAGAAQPGHFVHVLPSGTSSFDPLLRRAFSVFHTEENLVDILYRVEGRGTALLSQVRAGQNVNLLGPLGHTFVYQAEEMARYQISRTILIGGGVGVPPMAFLTKFLRTHLAAHDVNAIIGARSHHDLIGIDEFRNLGIQPAITTDDGSAGTRGLVTGPLEEFLSAWQNDGARALVYACGPWPMLKAVAHLCHKYKVLCQVSLEENMPCGIGVCNGCVIPVQGASDDYGKYRRICIDGPVMWSHEVLWEQPVASGD
jgi:dihydroorotate dehydrogenase electron transfer subunit